MSSLVGFGGGSGGGESLKLPSLYSVSRMTDQNSGDQTSDPRLAMETWSGMYKATP